MQQVSLKRIPNYLKARSPQGLRRLMLLNNAKGSAFYEYVNISPVLEGTVLYWYAWYYKDVDNSDITDLESDAPDTGATNG